MSHVAIFAAVFAALYAAHHVGDQWVQTNGQAMTKGGPGRVGRLACARHVATLTATKVVVLVVTAVALNLPLTVWATAAGFLVDAGSHYWADRRSTLRRLAESLNKGGYYALGFPREGHDDNATTGTGAYHLDQSWHVAFLWITALIIAVGA
jgi:hypothetical protein